MEFGGEGAQPLGLRENDDLALKSDVLQGF